MKAKCRARIYRHFTCILCSPFPICVIAPDFQPTTNIVTDKAQSSFNLGTADLTSNSPGGHKDPTLQLFNNRDDLSTFKKNKQISPRNACESHIAADLHQDQFGPYYRNFKKRLFDLTLWPGEPPVQKTPKQNKKTHSDKDWLLDSDLSVKDSRVLNGLDQERKTNEYYSQFPSNIEAPIGAPAYAVVPVHKAFVEPHSYNDLENPRVFNLKLVTQNSMSFSGTEKDLVTEPSDESISTKIIQQKSASIDSTPDDSPHNLKERGSQILVDETHSSLESHSLTDNMENRKIGNLDKDQFLEFLSPLVNSRPQPHIPPRSRSAVLQIFMQNRSEALISSKVALPKVDDLIRCAASWSLRFLRFFFLGPADSRRVEEMKFLSFLLNNSKDKKVQLELFVAQSDEIKTLISKYFEADGSETRLPVKPRGPTSARVSKSNNSGLELGFLLFEYYYKNMNKEKWEYLFGHGTQIWGFWATLKLKLESNNIARDNPKVASCRDELALFPWELPWDKPPQTYIQHNIAPTLEEWKKSAGAKFTTLNFSKEFSLPHQDLWMYEHITVGLHSHGASLEGPKQILEGNIQALEKEFPTISSKLHSKGKNQHNDGYNNVFFKKIEILMLKVFQSNLFFLNRVGKGNEFHLMQDEQKKTQNWLKESLKTFLYKNSNLNSPPGHNIPGESSKPKNSPLLSGMLEKMAQKESEFHEISGKFEKEMDEMITQLALIILEEYYQEINGEKWEMLFSKRVGSMNFVEFMTLCIDEVVYKISRKEQKAALEMRELFPWDDKIAFKLMPVALRNFKASAKRNFSRLQTKFSTQKFE
ncbi:hypothetical protein O181_037168 [Austropuccinia psidii MF-1]|uniref:Uncharacterized protein n=1 Tax=Austropuccinia psidii MF-1 TaxID=1389203 RepID=A0A9Q3H9U6_9BASI|nr:hypothetical protein [Austropuccinia psidii MF-1]